MVKIVAQSIMGGSLGWTKPPAAWGRSCVTEWGYNDVGAAPYIKDIGVADPRDDFTSLNPAISQVYRSIHPLNQQRQDIRSPHGL